MWKPVVGYEGYYEVSDLGQLRRVAAGRGAVAGRFVSTKRRNAKGYPVAELCVGDKKARIFLHRIVANAFLGPPPTDRHVVNHLDGIKTNCAASNLEWTTHAGNARHAADNGLLRPLRGEANGRAKLTAEQVEEIRRLKGSESQRDIAERFEVARSLVQRIHQGKAWAAEWPEDLRVREMP